MGLRQRIGRLAARLPSADPAACSGGTTAIIAEGEEPRIGPDTPRCRKCGGVHLLVVEEVVVDASGVEVDAVWE